MNNRERVGKSIIFIEENLTEAISVKEIADFVYTSYYHFHRIFQAVTGETIGNYVRKRRLTRAADDLIYTEKRIIDIAMEYQFESQEAFSRAFKNNFDLTPNNYRKQRLQWVSKRRDPLTEDMLAHLTTTISIQPEVVETDTFEIVGIGGKTSINNNRIPEIWINLWSRVGEIPQAGPPYTGISLSEYPSDASLVNFTEESDYFVVAGFQAVAGKIPEGMITRIIPAGKFALFTHVGPISTLRATYQYIWGTWTDNRKYKIDERSIFELYAPDYPGPESEDGRINIYIPIR